MAPVVETDRLKDQVVALLRERIITGQLEAGKRYATEELARELGLSRTPVREALLSLEWLGLGRFERNTGFRVQRLSLRDLAEIFEIFSNIYPQRAAELALEFRAVPLDELRQALAQLLQSVTEEDACKGPGPGYRGQTLELRRLLAFGYQHGAGWRMIERLWLQLAPLEYILWRDAAERQHHAEALSRIVSAIGDANPLVQNDVKNYLSTLQKKISGIL